MSLLRTKSIDVLIADSEEPGRRLNKTLGPWSLTALGIGAVIGSGIFILTGTAAAGETLAVPSILNAPVLDLILHGGSAVSTIGRPGAGPGISLSFLLVALVCSFAALCYAELASMIPIAGSAYTYAYATLGEIFAWIIGWDLILEYAVSNMAVAVGFSAYFNDILDALFGFHLPKYLSEPMISGGQMTGSWFNVPALLVILVLTWILVRGVKESASANNIMVVIKIVAILMFVFAAAGAVKTDNWQPFMPNGFSGVLTGAAIVFFTYIGFDSVSTAAEECQQAAARSAVRDHDDAGDLHGSVRECVAGADRCRELEDAGECGAGGYGVEGSRIRTECGRLSEQARCSGCCPRCWCFSTGRRGCGLRCRAMGCCRDSFRECIAVQDAACQHVGRGVGGWNSGGHLGYRHVRRSVEYRDAVRVHRRVGGRDRACEGVSLTDLADSACRWCRCFRRCRLCAAWC